MENLYTFSKNVWFVKLFKWVYGTDPTKTFNTMCPMFWSLVATIILLPIILIVKLFGKAGTNVLSKLESYKRDNQERRKNNFIEKCNEFLTDEEAYKIKQTNCWWSHSYYLEYKLEKSILDKATKHYKILAQQKTAKKERLNKVKATKSFIYSSYVISVLVIGTIIYGLYSILSSIEYSPIDWNFIIKIFTHIGIVVGIVVGGVILIHYILAPLFKYLGCLECQLCKPFKFVWKGIVIIADMIYMTYKKACPRITWKNN